MTLRIAATACSFVTAAVAQDLVEGAATRAVPLAPTIADATANAFSYPSPALDATGRRAFAVGNAIFRANWVQAPASAEGLDGLGPLFNARSCSSCHLRDGRSRPPEADELERHGLLVRIGVRTGDGADLPHPRYGVQLQDQALPDAAPEARIEVQWLPRAGRYADGEPFTLLTPRYELRELADGQVDEHAVLGGRTAPHLIGMGLLEAIPAAALHAFAEPDDRDGDGISGRVHVLPDSGAIGRFGWKATAPSVLAQTAGALVHDMGITSPLHPVDARTGPQRIRLSFAEGGTPEIDAHKLERLVFYAQAIAPPSPRADDPVAIERGRQHFADFGCAACHVPSWTTGDTVFTPALAGVTFAPYTDLLLHDLGAELADEKHDGAATPAEWRTAPLWGIGLIPVVNGHERLLHDGRARGIAEAILWHGGEAERSRERFRTAPAVERAALLAFVRSL
ncbi:MAG: thiol oxidoreductase [Planctomycetes bacterium]|nr:thiol oxidoreductase [Planctomycetota bacterium]